MNSISVLLVEDEPLLALDVETGLTDAGYTVTVATSGQDALTALSPIDIPFSALVTEFA